MAQPRELHDTFGQTMTSIVLAADEVEGALIDPRCRRLAGTIGTAGRRAVSQLREAIARVAASAEHQRPDQFHRILRDLSDAGVNVHFTSPAISLCARCRPRHGAAQTRPRRRRCSTSADMPPPRTCACAFAVAAGACCW